MSNGRFTKKKKKNNYIWLITVLVVALAGLIAFALHLGSSQGEQNETEPNKVVSGTVSDDPGRETTAIQSPESTQPQQPGTQATEKSGTQGTENSDTQSTAGKDTPDTQSTNPPQKETDPPVVETQPPVEIVEQAEADYERWLASAMLMGITMEYPDFEITGIYLASETTIENKMESKGCYILFNSAGQQMALHGAPLSAERTETGTRDISSQIIGYATFDLTDPNAVNTAAMIRIDMEEMSELIAQSMLVSIFSR